MILSAHQPNYLPYPGLFARIAQSDVFVFLDDVQYSKGDWHNRNRLRTATGWTWLTIPVHVRFGFKICQVYPAERGWSRCHREQILQHYRTSPWLDRLDSLWAVIQPLEMEALSTINCSITKHITELLGIQTHFATQSQLALKVDEQCNADQRLISLCKRYNCDTYLAGAGSSAYMNSMRWTAAGICVVIQKYQQHRYNQLHPGWQPNLSILDLLLCVADPYAHITSADKMLESCFTQSK